MRNKEYLPLEIKWLKYLKTSHQKKVKHFVVVLTEKSCHTYTTVTFWVKIGKQKTSYEKIYNGSISEKTEVFKRFEEHVLVRERIQNKCEITETASKVKQQRKIKKLPPCNPLV